MGTYSAASRLRSIIRHYFTCRLLDKRLATSYHPSTVVDWFVPLRRHAGVGHWTSSSRRMAVGVKSARPLRSSRQILLHAGLAVSGVYGCWGCEPVAETALQWNFSQGWGSVVTPVPRHQRPSRPAERVWTRRNLFGTARRICRPTRADYRIIQNGGTVRFSGRMHVAHTETRKVNAVQTRELPKKNKKKQKSTAFLSL